MAKHVSWCSWGCLLLPSLAVVVVVVVVVAVIVAVAYSVSRSTES